MNLYPTAAHIRHLLTSRSVAGHGVHSPFMFDFLNGVVNGKTDEKIASAIKQLRFDMLHDPRKINVTDMGTGSARGPERRISDIARTAAVPGREAGLLARMAHKHGAWTMGHGEVSMEHRTRGKERGEAVILELGTSLGISALAMALAAPDKKVITVEGCPAQAEIAAANLKKYGADNAEVLNMEFSAALKKLEYEGIKVSFAFVDGNHRGDPLREYIRRITRMGEEMIIIIDDIHLTREMYQSWRTIVTSGIAQTTMETLRLGIMFCLRRITPGEYRIRY